MSDPKDAEREISSSAGLKEEPGESAPSEPESPRSQAFLDLQASGLTPAEIAAARAETDNPTAAGEAPQKRPAAPGQAHWLALLSLSAAGSLALASASLPVRGLSFWLNGLAGLAVLLLLPSFMPHPPRFLPRLATRGGLAAALFSAALFLTAVFEGLGLIFFYTLPLALAWAGLSALVIIWTIAALGRKLGRRHKTAGFILALVLLYAALGPAWLLLGPFFPGAAGPADFFHRNIFSASPAFLTAHLPWPAWPQAVALGLAPLLAAFFALWDQVSAFRRPGARHGGNFFLALAFLGLPLSGLMVFEPTEREARGAFAAAIVKATWVLAPETPSPAASAGQPPLKLLPPEPSALEPFRAEAAPGRPTADQPADKQPEPEQQAVERAGVEDRQPAAQLEDLRQKYRETQARLEELEARLLLLSDRLNQLERPDRMPLPSPALPLPPEFHPAPNLTTPDVPLAPTPETPSEPLQSRPEDPEDSFDWDNYYSGGSST